MNRESSPKSYCMCLFLGDDKCSLRQFHVIADFMRQTKPRCIGLNATL